MKRKAKSKQTINHVPTIASLISFLIILTLAILFFEGKLTGLVAYGGNAEGANLTVWEENDYTQLPISSQIRFFANFSNLAGSPIYNSQFGQWQNLTLDGPIARFTSVIYDSSNNKLILFGGYNYTSEVENDTWAYDYATNTWSNRTLEGPGRKEYSAVFDSTNNAILLFGGVNNAGEFLNDTWAYDYATNTWSNRTLDGPVARSNASLSFDSSNAVTILFGGVNNAGEFLNDTWAYDYATNTWSNRTLDGPNARTRHSMAYDSNSGLIFIFGGEDGSTTFNDTWAYNYTDNTWTNISTTNAPEPRSGHSMAYDSANNLVISYGGTDGSNYFDDLWSFNTSTNTWEELYIGLPHAGSSSIAYDPDSGLIILFGGVNDSNFFNDTWAFNYSLKNTVCTFSENSSGSWSSQASMAYNESSGFFEYNKSIDTTGTYYFNITCNGTAAGYGTISLIESFDVSNCVPPSSGDWIIENSSNIICQNIPYLEMNGSINVTDDSNLTLTNSTLNSTNNFYFKNQSRLTSINSTLIAKTFFMDNSTLSFINSTSPDSAYGLHVTNISRSIIDSSYVAGLVISPEEEISIENITYSESNNAYISSVDFILNLTNTYVETISLVLQRNMNVSSSNITALNYSISGVTTRIYDSMIVGLTFDSDFFADNLVVSDYAIFNGGSNAVLNSSTINRIEAISASENINVSGNFTITQKSVSSFAADAQITRFFPIYVYNGSDELNGTANVTYNGQVLWSGTIANSYALINLTFNSTTYTNQYSLTGPRGYMGKMSLLDNTPITKTTPVSSIPLIASLLTVNGTLFNDTAYLQFSSNKDLTCTYSLAGASYLNATKTQSYISLFNGTYLRYNSTLNNSYPRLNSTQLPFILTQNIFAEFLGSNDNDVAYTEEFRMGSGGQIMLLGYGTSVYPTDKNATAYLYFENETANNMTYNYLLRFNNSIIYNNFSLETASDDLVGSRIKIQGRSFNISSLSVGGSGNAISDMTLFDGATSIKLNGASGKIQLNGTDIDNAYGYLMGTSGNWTGINITYYPNNRIYLAEGDEYTDPVLGRLKFVFANLNVASTENISLRSSQGNATLNFTDANNTLISIPYYSNGTHAFRGYNSTRPILIKGENYTVSTAGDQIGMLFFFVKNTTGEAHLLRLSAMNTSNNTIALSDDAYSWTFNSSYYNSTDNLSIIDLGSLGNITLNISADQTIIIYQNAPSITAKTLYGAKITLTQSGLSFNENNASLNNVSIQINITNGANWTYDTTNTLTRVSKIYGDNTIKLANTIYGTMIEDDNQNNSYITITHPQTSTYAEVYLAGSDVDNASLIAGTLPLSARFTASSNYTYNNLSLACTDGVETKYFDINVNISKLPQMLSEETTTTIESATINITTDLVSRISFRYGTTTAILNSVSYNESDVSHGIYLPGLASDMNYYYNLTICDIYARCSVTGPNSFITQHRESNPTSNEINYVDINTITNTNPFANRRFADMIAGQTYSSEMNFGRVPVTKVEFTARKDLDAAVFTFFKLKNSSDAPSLSEPEKVYSYMSFNLTKASFEDLSDVKITFRVDKTWFDQNTFTKDSITLNHYGGQWEELNTQYEKQDPFYHYYTTQVTGFSIFAITATKGKLPSPAQPTTPSENTEPTLPAQPSQPVQPTTPTVPRTDYNLGSQETNDANEPDVQEPSPVSQSLADRINELTQNQLFVPIAIAILALALVGGGVVVARRPKSMVQELARKQMTTQEVLTELKSKGVYGQSLEEMRQFISASIHEGKNANEIKAALLSVGWEEHIIDDVFQLFNVH